MAHLKKCWTDTEKMCWPNGALGLHCPPTTAPFQQGGMGLAPSVWAICCAWNFGLMPEAPLSCWLYLKTTIFLILAGTVCGETMSDAKVARPWKEILENWHRTQSFFKFGVGPTNPEENIYSYTQVRTKNSMSIWHAIWYFGDQTSSTSSLNGMTTGRYHFLLSLDSGGMQAFLELLPDGHQQDIERVNSFP